MTASITTFISHWRGADGGERAQSQSFLLNFCQALGLAQPNKGDYKFEFDVRGDKGRNFIDLYKRGCFVLESKQSRARRDRDELSQLDLLPPEASGPRRDKSSRAWDVLMNSARAQAENYARHLPPDHDWPPFIIVCDVGHCFEIYADFTGKGRNYTQFPDRQGFRIFIDDLAKPEVQSLFRAIWDDPHSLDPTRRAVKATRDVAERLAAVSKHMEQRKLPGEEVAAFLMRCIFTMFAEDVELLPKNAFSSLLERAIEKPHIFAPELEMLWNAMNTGDYASAAQGRVRKFNGNLFHDSKVFELEKAEIGELLVASRKDWREVDPSIFGTLLEQALDTEERSRLGAHYTPRAYVERLVIATVIDPIRQEWQQAIGTAEREKALGRPDQAIAIVQQFHDALCKLRILDPACGTGNFLYVALELMKRLEGDVIEALMNIGGQPALRGLEDHEVDPRQFLGLEVNPRACQIAELVLWIGYLQWHLRNDHLLDRTPVLQAYENISRMDAVLAHDGVDAKGNYLNPRRPDWPEADYIVGNPPFLGKGAIMRQALGDQYTEALWKAHPQINESADFVMFWWDRSAELLTVKSTCLKRFGLVTTNSVTQIFNRRVIEKHITGTKSISIVLAIPNHPWIKPSRHSASVRIAMTVAQAGQHLGILKEVVLERNLDSDEPYVEFRSSVGSIHADLAVGPDVTSCSVLTANNGISCNGMMLAGRGFVLSYSEASHFFALDPNLTRSVVRPYINGGELVRSWGRRFVIDLFGWEIEDVRTKHPHIYQHLLKTVKPERDLNRRPAFKKRWWVFGEPRRSFRPALEGLTRYIGTTETAKHRIFQYLNVDLVPDHMVIAIASDDAFHLGVLSSRLHVVWALQSGGWLGVGNDPRYSKSRCFDPFPFPDPDEFTRARIASIAEKLDAQRKGVQAAHPGITLTQIYNVLEKLKAGAALADDETRIRDDGLVLILKELHDELDHAVAQAYGWPVDLGEQDILSRLVALNKARAGEEAKGQVRWLRPDYQIPRFGSAREKEEQLEADLGLAPTAVPARVKPAFPAGAVEQTGAVMAALAAAQAPLSALDIAQGFRQGRKVEPQVRATLAAMARMGFIAIHDGGQRFTALRAA